MGENAHFLLQQFAVSLASDGLLSNFMEKISWCNTAYEFHPIGNGASIVQPLRRNVAFKKLVENLHPAGKICRHYYTFVLKVQTFGAYFSL